MNIIVGLLPPKEWNAHNDVGNKYRTMAAYPTGTRSWIMTAMHMSLGTTNYSANEQCDLGPTQINPTWSLNQMIFLGSESLDAVRLLRC